MLSYDGGVKEKPGVGGCHGNVHVSISTFTQPLCLFALQLIQHACTHLLYKCDNITCENNRPTTTVTCTVSESGSSICGLVPQLQLGGGLIRSTAPELGAWRHILCTKARSLQYVKLSLIPWNGSQGTPLRGERLLVWPPQQLSPWQAGAHNSPTLNQV